MAGAVEAPDALSPAAAPDSGIDFELDIDLDLDYLLQGFSQESFFDIAADGWIPDQPHLSSPSATSTPTEEEKSGSPSVEIGDSPGSMASYVSDLEKFLMEEEEVGEAVSVEEGFVADHFLDCLFAEGSRDVEGEVPTPQSEVSVGSESRKEEEEAPAQVAVDEENDDPPSKKLRRQIRNRDSAMKSRERKKMYVKDLEMKSKCLEAECRRLNYVLQCYATENMALRQSLQKERLFDASASRQESAVLFVESLLLGSLSWLVTVICLFLLPAMPNLTVNSLERGLEHEILVTKRVTNRNLEKKLTSGMVNFWKRCRGMRTRTKNCMFLLQVIPSFL